MSCNRDVVITWSINNSIDMIVETSNDSIATNHNIGIDLWQTNELGFIREPNRGELNTTYPSYWLFDLFPQFNKRNSSLYRWRSSDQHNFNS